MVDFRDMIDILVHFVYTGGSDFLVIQFFFSILTMSDILLTLIINVHYIGRWLFWSQGKKNINYNTCMSKQRSY